MNVLFSFTAFVLGVLLIIIILYNNRQPTAKLLAFFIFTIAYNSLLNFLWASDTIRFVPFLLSTGPLVAYLRAPCLFFYVLFLFNDKQKIQFRDAWQLIPASIYIISYLPLFFSDTSYKLNVIDELYQNNKQMLLYVEGWVSLSRVHIILKSIVTVLYIILLFRLWKKYRPSISDEVSNNNQVLNWIKVIVAIYSINGSLGVLIGIYPSTILIWVAAVWHTLSYCGVICVGLFFLPNILYGTSKASIVDPVVDRLKTATPSEENANLIKNRLTEFLEKKGFLQKQIKLADLANQIGVQPYILSAYINQVYQLRFNDFINFYRIQFVAEGLVKGEWGQLTLEAIGEKAGFTNRTTFLNAFKKYKGTTPTLFLHQHRFIKNQRNHKPDQE